MPARTQLVGQNVTVTRNNRGTIRVGSQSPSESRYSAVKAPLFISDPPSPHYRCERHSMLMNAGPGETNELRIPYRCHCARHPAITDEFTSHLRRRVIYDIKTHSGHAEAVSLSLSLSLSLSFSLIYPRPRGESGISLLAKHK